jgi:hypothetical protein
VDNSIGEMKLHGRWLKNVLKNRQKENTFGVNYDLAGKIFIFLKSGQGGGDMAV